MSQTVFHFDSDFQPDPLRIVFGKKYNAHTGGLFQSSGITKVENIFERDSLLMTFKYQNRSLPKAIIESFSQHEQDNLRVDTVSEFSLYEAFESAGHTINSANERVSSRLISNKEAEILSVVLPAAVTVVFRTSFNKTGRLIEASEAIYLSDFYSYEVNLARGVANIVSMK